MENYNELKKLGRDLVEGDRIELDEDEWVEVQSVSSGWVVGTVTVEIEDGEYLQISKKDNISVKQMR